ncbi:MAG: tetratricopeptide repeat protein, partial [Bacteroidales bacterium]|nr:tetratricopeptide repeat protein [Bacteroidales bacterium]
MKDRIMKYMLSVMFSFALFFVSCSDNRSVKELGKMETLMQEDPVKVLETLENIDERTLKGGKAKALYALLYSQAKDKNWIDETDDSLISIAVNYFKESNDTYHKFLSYFYCGRVYQNAGNLAKAIISFTKAEEMVTDMCDFYYVGLLYANLGLLYQDINNYTKSLEAFENAFKYYSNAGKHHHSMYAKLNMGNILLNMKQYDTAEHYLEEVRDWSFGNKDNIICKDSFRMLVSLYMQTENMEKLKRMFDSKYYDVCKDDVKLLQYEAYMSALVHDYRESEVYMSRAWEKASNSKDSATLYHRAYTISKLMGDYKKALVNHEQLLYIQDTIVSRQLQHPILVAQKDYYKEEARHKAMKLKQNSDKLIIISVASFIFLILMIIIHTYRIQAKQKKIEGYMDKIGNLENLLLSVHSDRSIETKEMSEKISSLFISQFSLIDKLSTTYYETHGSNKDKDAIYRQVTKEIEKLSKDKKYLLQLESIVNKYK